MSASSTRLRIPSFSATSPMWFPNIFQNNFIINRSMIFIKYFSHSSSTSITTKIPSARMTMTTLISICRFFIFFFTSNIKAFSFHVFFSFCSILICFIYRLHIGIFNHIFKIPTRFDLIRHSRRFLSFF